MVLDPKQRKRISDALKLKQNDPAKSEASTEGLAPQPHSALPSVPIDHFKSLEALNQHLSECYRANTGFQLTSASPEKDIAKFVLSLAQTEGLLETFKVSFSILKFTASIQAKQGQEDATYEHEALKLLSLYSSKISDLLQRPSPAAFETLQNFYSDFNKSKAISQLRVLPKESLSVFSVHHRLHGIFKMLDSQYALFKKKIELQSRQTSQQDYAQLLDAILEGEAPDRVVSLLRSASDREIEENTLLPKSDFFDVPSAEPEHPDRIGLNKTMSYMPPKEKSSIFTAFSTKALKAEFLSCFSWAADITSIHRLTNAVSSPNVNLLGTEDVHSPNVQLAAIRYVLLTLDALGKVCGNKGDLAIQNYPVIKDITDRLQELSKRLTEISYENDHTFIEEIKAMTHYLTARNQDFYDMHKQVNPTFNVKTNSEMNGFCHINERLAGILLNIDFKQSVLTPKELPYAIEKRIQHSSFQKKLTQHKSKPKAPPIA